ncbi:hypothetical protein AAE478_009485 [Parahypoxylon ruwenzoriense]
MKYYHPNEPAARFDYAGDNSLRRAGDAVTNGWAKAWVRGTSWEGTFTIPICDTGDVSYNVPPTSRATPPTTSYGRRAESAQTAPARQKAETPLEHARAAELDQRGAVPQLHGFNKDMVSNAISCSQPIANLGKDRDRTGRSAPKTASTGAMGRIGGVVDNSNIHSCVNHSGQGRAPRRGRVRPLDAGQRARHL